MSDQRELERLLNEFTRVGVDPDTFSAVLAVRPEDALQVLRELPDGAGPAAFLAQLRQLSSRGGIAHPHYEPRGRGAPRDEPRP